MFLESCSVENCKVLSAEFIFQGSEINVYVKQVHNSNTYTKELEQLTLNLSLYMKTLIVIKKCFLVQEKNPINL